MNVSHDQGVELAQRARLIADAKDGEAAAQQALVGRLRCGKRVASDPDAMRHALCAVRERSEP